MTKTSAIHFDSKTAIKNLTDPKKIQKAQLKGSHFERLRKRESRRLSYKSSLTVYK